MWMNECHANATEEQQCKLHLPLGYQFIVPQKWHWMCPEWLYHRVFLLSLSSALPSQHFSLRLLIVSCDRNNRIMMIMIRFPGPLPQLFGFCTLSCPPYYSSWNRNCFGASPSSNFVCFCRVSTFLLFSFFWETGLLRVQLVNWLLSALPNIYQEGPCRSLKNRRNIWNNL